MYMERKMENKKTTKKTTKNTKSNPVEKVEERNQILSKRAKVKMWQPIVGHIILIVVAAFLALIIALSTKKTSDMVSYVLMIVAVCLLGALDVYLIVSMILDIIKVSKYNKENEVYIEYKGDIFTLYMQNDKTKQIKKEDIEKAEYKTNNGLFFSPHYIYEQTYKLGKIIFVLKGQEEKILLKLVPDAEKVHGKISKILHKTASAKDQKEKQ